MRFVFRFQAKLLPVNQFSQVFNCVLVFTFCEKIVCARVCVCIYQISESELTKIAHQNSDNELMGMDGGEVWSRK